MWPPAARMASNTLTVPTTLTMAPSGGSAAQNGSCRPARCTTCVIPWSATTSATSRAAGHVERGEVGLAASPSLRDELEAAQVRAQVGGHYRDALVEQQPDRPGADAAGGAGDQESFRR